MIHTDEVIEGTDEPVRAIRRKKDSSMVRMAEAVKNGEADACVSAGNTGALMAAGLFIVGRIESMTSCACTNITYARWKRICYVRFRCKCRCQT